MTPILQTAFDKSIIRQAAPVLTTYRLGEGAISFTSEALEILRGFGSGDKWNELESAIFRQAPGTPVKIQKGELVGSVTADEEAKMELRKIGSHAAWQRFRSCVEVAPLREQSSDLDL